MMVNRFFNFLRHHSVDVVLILFIVVVLGLFNLLNNTVVSFKQQEIKNNMTWMGNSITYFCSTGYDQLARAGAVDDEIMVLLKQAETLETIENFVRNNEFEVVVFDVSPEKAGVILSSLAQDLTEEYSTSGVRSRHVVELQVKGDRYMGMAIPFSDWKWEVLLLKSTRLYDRLIKQLRGVYFSFGALVALLLFILILYLRHAERSARIVRKSRLAIKSTLDALQEGVVVLDRDGCIIRMNPAAEQLIGVDSAEVSGQEMNSIVELVPVGKTRPLGQDAYRVGGALHRQGKVGEYMLYGVTGNEKLVDARCAVFSEKVQERGDLSLVLSLHDVSDHRVMAQQLQQAQKMEVVGLMAGGVAHDLNNILSGIVSYPELLLLKIPEGSPLRQPVEAIRESGRRAAAIVADLLTVARGAASVRKIADLNGLVVEYANSPEFIRIKSESPDVSIAFEYGDNIPNIACSSVHIKKCIHNLLMNGIEAMAGEGRCVIATVRAEIKEKQARILRIDPGNYSAVRVEDTGPGISGADIEHIFEPFYTRKKMGRSGTGLGLAVVWNTMQDHGGTVVVRSGSTGTVFELLFPAVEELVDSVEDQVHIWELQGNGERILVVDDDPLQRDIARGFLHELKYTVDTVGSGEEAIERVQEEEYDLLLLDMIMDPGMNGRITYELILTKNPGQKALIVSGFSENEEVIKSLEMGAGGFVRKPYTLEQLGLSIKGVLGNEKTNA